MFAAEKARVDAAADDRPVYGVPLFAMAPSSPFARHGEHAHPFAPMPWNMPPPPPPNHLPEDDAPADYAQAEPKGAPDYAQAEPEGNGDCAPLARGAANAGDGIRAQRTLVAAWVVLVAATLFLASEHGAPVRAALFGVVAAVRDYACGGRAREHAACALVRYATRTAS
jgi:hypothetical protein